MTSIKYMTSLLTFYLKGEIRTEKNFIQFKTPNTILGLIPLGAKTEKFTIDQISSTTTNFRLRLKYLIFGIFWLLISAAVALRWMIEHDFELPDDAGLKQMEAEVNRELCEAWGEIFSLAVLEWRDGQ